MTLSVIIPTKNRHEDLLNTIKTVLIQTHMPNEIIIVDQNVSSEVKNAAMSVLNSDIAVKYIHDSQITGLTQARNRAIEKNKSDILIFLDDDVILEKDFIFNLIEIYKKYPEIQGVGGIITNMKSGLIGRFIHRVFYTGCFTEQRFLVFNNPEYKDVEYVAVSSLSGCAMSFRKEIFQEFKFDEKFIKYSLSEDRDFSFRVSRKYKIVITPKARLEHVVSDSARIDHIRERENYVLTMHYFFKKNVDKKISNYLSYIWLISGFIVHAILFAVFKKNINILIGYLRGFKKLMKGESSDFIRPDN